MAEYLYIHIPFCMRKCKYCDFLSVPFDESLARRYTRALCTELGMKKDLTGTLKTVFFGGGTPAVLSEKCFHDIFDQLRKSFVIDPSAEITIEANPGTLTQRKLHSLVALGVTRLSIGVQSFQNSELNTLGRIHDADGAIRAAEMIRAAGIGNFSIDLIYGIPGQNMQTWRDSLDQAVILSPSHISAYELTPEAKTPLKEALDSGDLIMPAEELILAMADLSTDHLAASGYEQYEISNYARPGYQCLHNMNYWDRGEYLAAGAGAHGFVRGFRTRNSSDIAEYIEKLSQQSLPEIERSEISCEDALREFVFLGLRKTAGIRLSDASALDLDLTGATDELRRMGLAELEADHFRLTRKGRYIANEVIIRLLENLGL